MNLSVRVLAFIGTLSVMPLATYGLVFHAADSDRETSSLFSAAKWIGINRPFAWQNRTMVHPAPILRKKFFDCLRSGCTYDARKETLDERLWRKADVKHGPGGRLVRESHPPVVVYARLPMREVSSGLWDSGQGMGGIAEILAMDALASVETGLFNFESESVYLDWLRGIVDVQRPNGQIPAKSPVI